MKRTLCRWILHLSGWTIGPDGGDIRKSVICVAPHTSNLDLTLGKLFYNALGKKSKFLMKKEWFFFPFNVIFKSMGGIPINRDKSSSTTAQIAREFARHDIFHIAITPEGTRKRTKEWKRGFYYIALKAGIPIQVAYIDYGKKEVGIKAIFYPTGNADADILTIRSMYDGIKGYHDKNFEKLKMTLKY
ncbi:MAG: 1-acyl-sn-glycerol-3-phosphate acyltransferase [Tannerella sp.]|nr:1-acyl-sn-glycerol-3-phosphate acyltransferase [Tannerella sp.]